MTPTRRTAALAPLTLLLLLGGCGFCISCRTDYVAPARPDPEVLKLAAFMTGSFSSSEQAAADPAYRAIDLEMARIWKRAPEAAWFYVEQAVAGRRDRPYRQRIYRLARTGDDAFVSEVYLLPDEASWVGAWAEPARFDALTPADLVRKEGCGVRLARVNSWTYAGGTGEASCPSELHGAAWATSEVEVQPGRITTWDRGWDAEGKQVWGAERGPYVFLRADRTP